MEEKALNIRGVDDQLLEQFKLLCHINHITIKDAVINLVKLSVRKQIIPK